MLANFVDTLWNPYLLLLFIAVGLYCSILTGFSQVSFGFCIKQTIRQQERADITAQNQKSSQFASLCTALATTIGTGSIAGVATAIWWGGAGAIFWMWVSAFLGMILSACERILTLQYRVPVSGKTQVYQGGPMYYLEQGVGSPFLGRWFAVACAFSALVGGNVLQSSSIAQGVQHLLPFPPVVVGLCLMTLVAYTLVGGMETVRKVSTILVPLMAGFYILGGLYCIFSDIPLLLAVLQDIFTSAFTTRSMIGGTGGYSVLTAVRYGMARGIFSNEAGLGAGAMAHANAKVDHPVRQGLWGMIEVFFATMIVCTLTALVLLTSGIYQGDVTQSLFQTETDLILPVGVPMTQQAFSVHLGDFGSTMVLISLVLFAFTSILGWSCYGKESVAYLSDNSSIQKAYAIVLLLGLILGSLLENTEILWIFLDLSLFFMAVPNLIGLLILAPKVCGDFFQWMQENK